MTTLVTGAAGFVGSHVVDDLLARGQPVRAFVRKPEQADRLRDRGAEVVVGDVRDAQAWAGALRGVEVVHHCAAAVGPGHSKQEIYDTNLHGVRRLLEALRQAGPARLVLLSSVNVLGTRHLDPATEDLPYRRSHDPAADVKIEAEQVTQDYAKESGGAVTILRPGFIYGPGDHHNLPRLASAVARGKFAFIGSRDNVVPVVHVQDVVQAMRLAATAPTAAGRVYNITDGSRTTIGAFVDYVAERLGCPPPQRILPYAVPYLGCVVFEVLARLGRRGAAPINRAGLRFLGTSRFVDIQRARQELGYQPAVGYREGVAATLDWIKEHAGEHPDVATPAP